MFGIDRFYLGYPAIGKETHKHTHTQIETLSHIRYKYNIYKDFNSQCPTNGASKPPS